MGKAAQVWQSPDCRRSKLRTKMVPVPALLAGQRCEAFFVAELASIRSSAAEPRNSCEFSYNQKSPFRFCAPRSRRAGYSLIEVLVVVAVFAILAGAVVTQARPNVGEGLRGTARVVAADMDRARELAVAGSSSYGISFNIAQNFYRLTHTGANPALDVLPRSCFGDPADSRTQWTQRLSDLPRVGPPVVLFAVRRGSTTPLPADDVEFGPLGETTQSEPTVIWLASGNGDARQYISITINAVTGVSSIGNLRGASP